MPIFDQRAKLIGQSEIPNERASSYLASAVLKDEIWNCLFRTERREEREGKGKNREETLAKRRGARPSVCGSRARTLHSQETRVTPNHAVQLLFIWTATSDKVSMDSFCRRRREKRVAPALTPGRCLHFLLLQLENSKREGTRALSLPSPLPSLCPRFLVFLW